MMRRFHVFGFNSGEELGGANDWCGSSDTLEEAKKIAETVKKARYLDCVEVFDFAEDRPQQVTGSLRRIGGGR